MSLLLLWNAGVGVTPPAPVLALGNRVRPFRKRRRADWAPDPAWKNVELNAIAAVAAGPAVPSDDAVILDLLAWEIWDG